MTDIYINPSAKPIIKITIINVNRILFILPHFQQQQQNHSIAEHLKLISL